MDNNKEELPQKIKKGKDPCRQKRIDFHLCQKQYGFNDTYCKYYLELYETCAKKNKEFYCSFD